MKIYLICVACFVLGWWLRGSFNEIKMKEAAKKEFISAVTYGINSGQLIVNRDKFPTNMMEE